jgi:hypothetical protein
VLSVAIRLVEGVPVLSWLPELPGTHPADTAVIASAMMALGLVVGVPLTSICLML